MSSELWSDEALARYAREHARHLEVVNDPLWRPSDGVGPDSRPPAQRAVIAAVQRLAEITEKLAGEEVNWSDRAKLVAEARRIARFMEFL